MKDFVAGGEGKGERKQMCYILHCMIENAGEMLNGGETVYPSGGLNIRPLSLQSTVQHIRLPLQSKPGRSGVTIQILFCILLLQNRPNICASKVLFLTERTGTHLD